MTVKRCSLEAVKDLWRYDRRQRIEQGVGLALDFTLERALVLAVGEQ